LAALATAAFCRRYFLDILCAGGLATQAAPTTRSQKMLRSMDERAARQENLRARMQEQLEEERSELLTLAEAARELRVSRSTARNLLRNESGVNLIRTPGSKRPMIRVERSVIERIRRRTRV
jgi:hypothetical protein